MVLVSAQLRFRVTDKLNKVSSHTAVAISDLLDDCLKEWKLSNVSATTDNGDEFRCSRSQITSIWLDCGRIISLCVSLLLVFNDVLTFKGQGDAPALHPQSLIREVQAAVVFIRGYSGRGTELRTRQEQYRKKLKHKELVERARLLKAENIAIDASMRVDLKHAVDQEVNQVNSGLIDNEEDANQREVAEDRDAAKLSTMDHWAIVSRANRLILRNVTRWSSSFMMLEIHTVGTNQ